ncbi:MAG: FKBP-type peptidyl-prolyl cis-trans isomerase [Pseudomonadota bacterium]
MRLRKTLFASLAALGLAACGQQDAAEDATAETLAPESEVTDAENTPIDVAAAAAEREKLAAENAAASKTFLEENAKLDGVVSTEDGLQYLVLESKDGVKPKMGDLVDIEYVATLKDGVEFDSSGRMGAAARFPLGDDLPGWAKGIALMGEGDRFRFFAPPELAYGERGAPPKVGPNEAVIYEVELLKVHSAERNLAAAESFLSDNAKKDGIKTTATGLQYEVLTAGDGAGDHPTAADIVKVHYQGTLLNGTEFDSSYSRGEPIEFPLARVIPGWTEGVQLMKPGDKYRFYIKPELGYGEAGTPGGPIGPNEALIFDVELLEVK